MTATVTDHPIRIARLKLGLGQVEFASRVGVSRPALVAIEDGRTAVPSDEVIVRIARELDMKPDLLELQLAQWRKKRQSNVRALMSPTQRAALEAKPATIGKLPDFTAWREQIAPTVNAFATLVGMNSTTLASYERGLRVREGMPAPLARALLNVLGLSPEQVVAVQELGLREPK